ncbi:hypothetical protein AB0K60_37460 [Thermopolyspora sp. NPDC052614]|uniref:hypothetical protein n=1 Tax=Thermopolyspora sp. NPDC052614 TaxID=3155682 RepID=UPI0034404C94
MDAARSRPPVAGWIVWSLRVTTVTHLVMVLAQAVLAGMFITGDVDLLRVHSVVGQVASGVVTLQFVAAILLWRPGGGAAWPLWLSLLLTALEGVQHTTGFNRTLDLHIPLGMLIFGLSAVMTTWACGRIERGPDGPAQDAEERPTPEVPAGRSPA